MDSKLAGLNDCLESRLADRRRTFSYTSCLLITWENASETRLRDAEEFGKSLEERLGVRIEGFRIPLVGAEPFLKRKVDDFIAVNSNSRLVLVYYSGGGELKNGRPFWRPLIQDQARSQTKHQARRSSGSSHAPAANAVSSAQATVPKLDWFKIQEILERSSLDTGLIFDCDYGRFSGHPERVKSSPLVRACNRGTGKLEILVARCDATEPTSFTRTVMVSLKALEEKRFTSQTFQTLSQEMKAHEDDHTSHWHRNLPAGPDSSSIHLQSMKVETVLCKGFEDAPQPVIKQWASQVPEGAFKAHVDYVTSPGNRVSGSYRRRSSSESIGAFQVAIHFWDSTAANAPGVHDWISKMPLASISGYDSHLTGGTPLPVHSPPWPLQKRASASRYLDIVVDKWNSDRDWETMVVPQRVAYKTVRVFPIIFQQPGFDIVDKSILVREVEEVRSIFGDRELFNFEVDEVFRIPPDNNTHTGQEVLKANIRSLVTQLSRDGKKDTLLIVIYSGHGKDTRRSGGRSIWQGEKEQEVDWTEIQDLLDDAKLDVAQLLDCCYSASAAKAPLHGRNEIITASGHDKRTYLRTGSFLDMIANALREFAGQGEPFSLLDLYTRLVTMTSRHNANPPEGSSPQPTRFYQLRRGSPSSINIRPASYKDPYDNIRCPIEESQGGKKYVYAQVEVNERHQPGSFTYMTREQMSRVLEEEETPSHNSG